jgi:hypothetical protein
VSNFRNRRLLDLAHKVHECQACGRWVHAGCEPAHANWSEYGKGGSLKSHDVFHAAMCHECHVSIDQGSRLTREERHEVWRRAFNKTQLLYWECGWIKVV